LDDLLKVLASDHLGLVQLLPVRLATVDRRSRSCIGRGNGRHGLGGDTVRADIDDRRVDLLGGTPAWPR